MHIRKLSEVGGIEIEGIDLSVPSSDGALGKLFDEHALIVFRNQKLTKQKLLDATHHFGGPMIDELLKWVGKDPDVPGIVVISTRGPTGDVVPEDPDALVGKSRWHTDQGWVTAPTRGTILYATEVPEEGGKTGFIDGQLTYDALPEDMKKRIEGLHVIHSWNLAESQLTKNRAYRVGGDKYFVRDRFPDLAYPIVYDHPISGAKVLNVPPTWAAGIVEMPGAEGDVLIEELQQHITQPKFQYWHSYRVGDAVLSDNWRFIHAASGTPGRYRRTLWSAAIKNGPELGTVLPTTDAQASSA